MEISNFHIFIPQRGEKAHFEKLQDGMQYILLYKIYTNNKNNNENNNKNHRPE